jgi:redox-sensitive bicupin YhaK (pirin superfamily)
LAIHRQVWVHVAEGQLVLNGEALSAGDAAAVSEVEVLSLTATAPAQVLLFDLA